ncbi:galactose-specific lectin nattectin-like isoform X1 [Crassostrea virginica]
MQYICTVYVMLALVIRTKRSNATQQEEEKMLMKTISNLHFQLFSSMQKNTKIIKTAVFETQCSGSGCTFNGCESSDSETCDGQMIQKLNEIQSCINAICKRKPKVLACKLGWKRYNGHCYYLYTTKMNWFEAQVFCRKQGTFLLQINDANENKWVSETFPNVEYWIDYFDGGMEGKWVTFSSGKSIYSNWEKNQPDNAYSGENCAHNNLYRRGYWNDRDCLLKRSFVCEASGKPKYIILFFNFFFLPL